MSEQLVEHVARAICRERCAFKGEPPCWEVGAWPPPTCDEPGCVAFARAAIAAIDSSGTHIVVPVEPTRNMIVAALEQWPPSARNWYGGGPYPRTIVSAAIAAAPRVADATPPSPRPGRP